MDGSLRPPLRGKSSGDFWPEISGGVLTVRSGEALLRRSGELLRDRSGDLDCDESDLPSGDERDGEPVGEPVGERLGEERGVGVHIHRGEELISTVYATSCSGKQGEMMVHVDLGNTNSVPMGRS